MKSSLQSLLALTAVAGAACLLGGCAADSRSGNGPFTDSQFSDFGRSVRQDIAAQIADPDPAWKKDPSPASSGRRASLAQKRYQANSVLKSTTSTTTIGAQGSETGGATASTGP